eukprot:gnl/TRDRNA2_/TRDRNA2_161359_c3_seq3.p1 gnl/TRDRNA2_/TRDRNA2_161359_c3~~gnl/TRDRNA2_/TRDRNA2_161359_c3_seq3.p1  ORF type:complete len:169 (-),score=17.47 gnl/TRDRNA2_/TRDRNA2_161359_c3_seq3:57-563(-)
MRGVNNLRESTRAMGEMGKFVVFAHQSGILSSREADAMLHPLHHHMALLEKHIRLSEDGFEDVERFNRTYRLASVHRKTSMGGSQMLSSSSAWGTSDRQDMGSALGVVCSNGGNRHSMGYDINEDGVNLMNVPTMDNNMNGVARRPRGESDTSEMVVHDVVSESDCPS